jgi:peptide/nickel transport system permease protein
MLSYMIRRLFLAILTLWLLSILSFIIIQAPPGDYVTAYISELQAQGTEVSRQEEEALRQRYALDEPLFVQYASWMRQILRGNFGMSMEYNRPVIDVIGDRIWLTVVVSVASLLLTWVVAVPIGIYSAVRQYSVTDYLATFLGFIGLAVPNFLLALVLMYFGHTLLGASVGGLFSSEYATAPWSLAKVWDLIKHLPIPAAVIGLSGTAMLIRILRANLLDELSKPYVETARARGLSEWRLILKYPVRVALNPLVSSIGFMFPILVSGSIIVSIVLGLPTVGPVLLQSLLSQDMLLAGTIVLFLGVMTVIGMLVSDVLLMLIDPRIRMEGR